MNKKQKRGLILFISFVAVVIISKLVGFTPGTMIGANFLDFTKGMLKVLPTAFVLIGLFEVWVPRETVEKNFGKTAGFKGYIWSILLASTTVGGLYVAFPVAYSLYKKGAKYSSILIYISSAALVRIPMTLFEASYVGLKFTAVRWITSIPLIILSSIFMEKYLEKNNITLIETSDTAGS